MCKPYLQFLYDTLIQIQSYLFIIIIIIKIIIIANFYTRFSHEAQSAYSILLPRSLDTFQCRTYTVYNFHSPGSKAQFRSLACMRAKLCFARPPSLPKKNVSAQTFMGRSTSKCLKKKKHLSNAQIEISINCSYTQCCRCATHRCCEATALYV